MSIIHLLENTTYLTLFICLILSLLLSGVILAASYNLALQTPDSEKTSAYECGFEPFEDARNRFDVRFYIVAILFLIFDIEVVYLFP
jgi:NADH-quinone oxidoreductase subunit A